VTIVVPYAAGGITDILARMMAERLAPRLGVPVVAENRTGAGGLIAAQAVARAPADGHTLLMHSNAILVAAANAPDQNFDPTATLAPVVFVAGLPSVLVVHPSVPARTVPELLQHIRASSGRVNCGVLGEGSSDHQSCQALARAAGGQMEYPVYRGLPPLNVDLLAGAIQINIGSLPVQMPLVREGRLRALAVATAERLPELPDLPTLRESGVDWDFLAINALFAPAGTPAAVIGRLNAEAAAILQDPAVRTRIASVGAILGPLDSASLGESFRRDWERAVAARQR
jgi:tripartite-type tricarboxylate transporter receptor subunit TctC